MIIGVGADAPVAKLQGVKRPGPRGNAPRHRRRGDRMSAFTSAVGKYCCKSLFRVNYEYCILLSQNSITRHWRISAVESKAGLDIS
jgi:hypothetical protein